MRTLWTTCLALFLLSAPVFAQDDGEDAPLPTIAEKTEGMEAMDGYVPVYWDAKAGKIWLEIPRFDTDFLYVTSLPAGLGSNPVGLDRGQLGTKRVVRFERIGPKVLMVEPNLDYRATSSNPAERRAVQDAFAAGVIYGFEVAAEGTGERDGHVLVEATDFVVRDAHGIARTLKEEEQGDFSLSAERSAPYLPNLKAFPQNTELEARLTFTTDEEPGAYVRETAADPFHVTLRVRHSLIQLPDTAGFSPRRFHPRSGYYPVTYADYAVPIGEDIAQRVIRRHRLQCASTNPDPDGDGLCTPEEPIVYYVDDGTPEPVQSALLDGARWWNQAFEAAGFDDAFRVEVLPDTADAMDVRYNTIQWVHRRTRGWSYGDSVVDPRTGEIIKGHVTLGSLRVRQDYLLAEGLLAPYQGGTADGFLPENDPMLEMALARIRQLSAHEVGHTIGIAHNFAASVNDRASVMDYPAPLATVTGDSISVANAYDVDIGEWDEVAVRYGYALPDSGETEAQLLDRIVQEGQDRGLLYLTDRDARPAGAAQPESNLWDNGSDVVDALEREMSVRRVALDRFDERTIRRGEPMAELEEVLVPLYLRHRYQVEGTVKAVGGVTYDYALRGDADVRLPEPVSADQQTAALDALLATITPGALALPEAVRTMIPPRPPGSPASRELFDGRTGLTFDATAPAEVAASMVLGLVVHPHRAARLVAQHDSNGDLPSLRSVLDRVTDQVWKQEIPDDAHRAELQRAVQQVWTDVLLDRAGHADVGMPVQARTTAELRSLADWLADNRGPDAETRAHRVEVRTAIQRLLDRSHETASRPADLETPPGSPIGSPPAYHVRQQKRQDALEQWAPTRRRCGEAVWK